MGKKKTTFITIRKIPRKIINIKNVSILIKKFFSIIKTILQPAINYCRIFKYQTRSYLSMPYFYTKILNEKFLSYSSVNTKLIKYEV